MHEVIKINAQRAYLIAKRMNKPLTALEESELKHLNAQIEILSPLVTSHEKKEMERIRKEIEDSKKLNEQIRKGLA